MSTVALILGGIRSGKSAYAEGVVAGMALGRPVIYIATGVAADGEMAERIRRHRERRPGEWQTLEAPLNPTGALRGWQSGTAGGCSETGSPVTGLPVVLLDSLDGWVGNLMFEYANAPAVELEARMVGAVRQLVADVRGFNMDAVVVSSEVGQSLVSANAVGRRFQDLLGTVNQALAGAADEVTLVVAGIPMAVKRAATPR